MVYITFCHSVFMPSRRSWKPVPVAAPSKVQVCGRSSVETVGSNPARDVHVCLLLVFCVAK